MSGMRAAGFDLQEVRQAPGFWYVGTPYTNYPEGLDAAAHYAAAITGALMSCGLQVYSPIAHCHPIAMSAGLDATAGKFWMKCTSAVRRAATGLIVVEMLTWEQSSGLTAEREEFSLEGKPVYHLNRVALARLVQGLKG
jgi:nucleoside 2-deoxyribosyltransferase